MTASPEAVAAPHADFYEMLYRQLNPFGKEELEAATIAAFLKGASGLNVAQLSQIWEIASELSGYKNRGILNRLGVFMCFKLIAAIQQGCPLSASLLPVPLPAGPRFGSSPAASALPTPPPPPPSGAVFAAPPKSPSIGAELAEGGGWPIGAEEQRKYEAIFDSLGPIGGKLLGGDQCKPVLLNSQLPKTLLAKIWELADMDSDGFLDRPEFCVALHLVYKALQNEPIPDQLPPQLIPPFKKAMIHRRMSSRSVEPTHPHPPPLSWSSRASSIASLNMFPHQPPPPISPPSRPPYATPSQQTIGKMTSLFDRNVEEWRVDNVGKYEAEFGGLDTDGDGLLGGADVRDVFLRSGLPQQALARIWAHVDVAKRGKLNLEQYAKCVELIRECQNPPPAQSQGSSQGATAETETPTSPPASSANLARRDSHVSDATNNSSGGGTTKAENQRVAELNAEIEEIQQGRRKAEEELFQAEADLKVKNSEIRNLEIESLTLNATVKQLKNQRVEANKRLNDLDKKIEKLEGVCVENQRRLEEDEARLAKTKEDIQNAKQNSQAEEEMLAKLRMDLQAKREHRDAALAKLRDENAKFEGFVDELTQLERGMAKNEAESGRLKAQMAEMERILAEAEKGDEAAKKELLERTFHTVIGGGSGQVGSSRSGSIDVKAQFGGGPRSGGADPFAGGDPSKSAADPFGNDDPFGGSKPAPEGLPSQPFANFANFSAFT